MYRLWPIDTTKMKTYPLLDSQLGILLSCTCAPASTAWNLPSVICFDKTVSPKRLLNAILRVCEERTELHVQFIRTEDGVYRQYADKNIEIPAFLSKMSDQEADLYMSKGFVRPFLLFTRQALCRFEVVETETRVLLLSDLHHSIADGFTIARQLIGTDLPTAYLGKRLEAPAMTLFDWALREQEVAHSPAYNRARDYFQKLFSDAEVTRLSDKGGLEDGKCLSDSFSVRMGDIDGWCEARHVSAFHFLMAAFSLTLGKLSYHQKVAFCTLNHGRYDKRLSAAYGMFVNTVPVVVDMPPNISVSMLVEQIRKRLLDNYRHRGYPFTRFCSDLGVVPKITFGFQSNGILEQMVIEGRRFPGKQLARQDAQSDFSVMAYSSGEDYDLRVEASDAAFSREDLGRFCGAMRHCIVEMMLDESRPIGEIELVDGSQKAQLMRLSAGEQTDVDLTLTVVGLFLRQVVDTPDAIAVTDGSQRLTYRNLEQQSGALALRLMAEGVGDGTFVGVDTTPCCEYLVAVMAIMRAGGTYVPIDPHLPEMRKKHIIRDAEVKTILNANDVKAILNAIDVNTHACMDTSAEPLDRSIPSGIAYMIYTSGSTGLPKGVAIRHVGLSNLISFCVRRWPLHGDSRIACHSSLAFDASVEDLFPVLSVGGSVVMVPEAVRTDFDKLARFMRQNMVTGGCLTTRLGVALAEDQTLDVDYLCLGGERLISNPSIKGRVYNTYGPTEFTVDATYCELEKGRVYEQIPIGRPLDNCHAFVVDPYGCLLPRGAVGELWLAGPQIAAGYWHEPELSAEKFTTCSFHEGLVYHTGDLVRWNGEGQLDYVGRFDHLVKIDGMRISLDEIELQLLALPGISQAAVVAREVNGREQIQAFYTSGDEVSGDDLRKALGRMIPPQMIPKHLVRLERMPLTPSGKVDRGRLHVVIRQTEDVQQQDPSVKALCGWAAQVLDLPRMGADDDFFSLGGTSLTAMQLVAVARKGGLAIEFADIFSHPTPRLMAKCARWKDDTVVYGIDDYDYESIHQLLEQGDREPVGAFPDGGTVLLTGATGLLGIHVMARFMASRAWRVTCLVRGRDEQEAWERLHTRWMFYFPQQPLDEEAVRVVCGDLTLPATLGESHIGSFDILINCAADVRYFSKDDNIMEVNVKGVGRLAKLCMAEDARLIQVSTLSIAGVGSAGGLMPITPQQLYVHQRLADQYSYSKLLAEREILQWVADGELNANIIRVGYLAPRLKDGFFPYNTSENMISSMLQVMFEVGGCPESASHMEIAWSPVDEVAGYIYERVVSGFPRVVMHVEGLRYGSMRGLAGVYAGKELALWPDDVFLHQLSHPHKMGMWAHLLELMKK